MHPYLREYLRRLRLLAWNETEQRPRSVVRVYLFWMVYAVVSLSIPALIDPSGTGLLRTAGLRLLLVLCTVGLLFAAALFLDKRPVYRFGLRIDRYWLTDSVVGALIGSAIPTAAVLLGLSVGWLAVHESTFTLTASTLANIGLAIVVTVCIALVEELVYRGYILTNAIEGLDLRWVSSPVTIASAWGISAFLFAVVHPAPTLLVGFHYLGAGLLLGLAYLITGQLALSVGIHAGFNFVSGYVFPLDRDPSVSIAPLAVQGPEWLIGQAGVLQTGFQISAAIFVVFYGWWRSGSLGISPAIKGKIRDKS